MGYIFQQDLPRQCWKVGSKLSFSRTNLLSQLAEKCKRSIRKHFFLRKAAVVNWLSSCLTGKMERKNGMTPIPRRWSSDHHPDLWRPERRLPHRLCKGLFIDKRTDI